jgi:hypothetical protein
VIVDLHAIQPAKLRPEEQDDHVGILRMETPLVVTTGEQLVEVEVVQRGQDGVEQSSRQTTIMQVDPLQIVRSDLGDLPQQLLCRDGQRVAIQGVLLSE